MCACFTAEGERPRRTPTQNVTRHSDSLPVQELLSLGLPMTSSATSNGNFPHNVVESKADRISALCFTACPRTGVLQSSDDTLCNFERGLFSQRR